MTNKPNDINWTTFCFAIATILMVAVATIVFKAATVRLVMPIAGIILIGYLSYVYFWNVPGDPPQKEKQ